MGLTTMGCVALREVIARLKGRQDQMSARVSTAARQDFIVALGAVAARVGDSARIARRLDY